MISIIIPIYNVEEFIVSCLQSVVAQTYNDYEVVLVDDCGTDRSMKLVNEFLKDSPFAAKFHIIRHDENRGLSAARNTGTKAAKGEYILYLDSDDTILPNTLEKLIGESIRTDAEMVIGNIHVIGEDKWIPKLKSDCHLSTDCFHDYLQGQYYMMAWNKLVKRNFLEKNHITFVEGLIHEDCAWSFIMACHLKKVSFVFEETYNYLVRNNSIQTDRNFSKHFKAYCFLLKYYADVANKYGRAEDSEFRWWFECQKALFFGITCNQGTMSQQRQIYKVIRRNLPSKGWDKMRLHSQLPALLGIFVYKKWFGMYLL